MTPGSQQPKYRAIKAMIPCETIFMDLNVHHVYLVRDDGTSDLLGVFRKKGHADAFCEYLASCASHTSASEQEIRADEREMVLDVALLRFIQLASQNNPNQSRFVWLPVIEQVIIELRCLELRHQHHGSKS